MFHRMVLEPPRPVENDSEIVSPWYELEHLVWGLSHCASGGDVKRPSWSEYRLYFALEFSHMWLVVESDWYPFEAVARPG